MGRPRADEECSSSSTRGEKAEKRESYSSCITEEPAQAQIHVQGGDGKKQELRPGNTASLRTSLCLPATRALTNSRELIAIRWGIESEGSSLSRTRLSKTCSD